MTCLICGANTVDIVAELEQRKIYRCPGCGARYLSPQLTDGELGALYQESYYKSWGVAGGDEAVKRMKTATFDLRLDAIGEYKRSGNILDVGCATGYFLEAAKQRGFRPYGVEISKYAGAAAKKSFGEESIHEGVLEDCPFPEKYFDVIAMSDLLEHVRDPHKTLRAARRLLKDDGILMVMTPDTDSLTGRFMGGGWIHYKAEHFFYFNKRSLNYLAAASGFTAARFGPAKKAMNLEYCYTQFKAYPHRLLSPLAGFLHGVLPRGLREKNFYVTLGELVVIFKADQRP